MANYADIVWNAAQYKLKEMMLKPEFKHKPSTTLMTLKKNTEFLVPASERERVWNTKTTDQHTVEIATLDKQATTAKTARAAAHTGSINDGTKTTLTFVTRGRTFKYSLKQADGKIQSLAEMIAVQLRSAAIDLHGTLETYFLGLLNTNKSQVDVRDAASISQSGYTWDGDNYIAQIANADNNRAFQRIRAIMRQNYYQGQLDSIVDEYFIQEAEYLIQQGRGNATNLGWQFGSLGMGVSEELVPDEGYLGMGYVFPVGTVGFVDWLPRLNRDGFGATFQNGGSYSTIDDPLGSGLKFAVHQYAAGADNEGAAGETQDVDVEVEISLDVAFAKAPMSTSNASPIFKTGILE